MRAVPVGEAPPRAISHLKAGVRTEQVTGSPGPARCPCRAWQSSSGKNGSSIGSSNTDARRNAKGGEGSNLPLSMESSFPPDRCGGASGTRPRGPTTSPPPPRGSSPRRGATRGVGGRTRPWQDAPPGRPADHRLPVVRRGSQGPLDEDERRRHELLLRACARHRQRSKRHRGPARVGPNLMTSIRSSGHRPACRWSVSLEGNIS